MSFGFSIGDIIKLVELTASAYSKWKNACGSYTSITRDLSVLQTILQRIEGEAKLPDSLFSRHPEDFKGWRSLVTSCEDVVTELADIVGKYKSLGSGKQKTWDRIRMANQDINAIHSRLVKATTSLNALVAVTGIGSLGRIEGSQQRVEGSFDRVENEVLPELLQKMDKLAEQMRKGNATSVTALTTYSDDDKSIWKEFRRDLINAGIRSRDIHRHSPALRTYLARLQREGLLDETEPQPLDNVPERYLDSSLFHMTRFALLILCAVILVQTFRPRWNPRQRTRNWTTMTLCPQKRSPVKLPTTTRSSSVDLDKR